MKAKVFYLGLLSTLTLINMNVEAMDRGARFRTQAEAPAMKKEIEEAKTNLGETPENLKNLVNPAKDVKTGLDKTLNKVGAGGGHADLHQKVKHLQTLVQPGADLTAGIGNTNALLGAGGGHADLHQKVTHLQTLVEPGTDLTAGIGHTNDLLGVGYEDAADAAAALGGADGGPVLHSATPSQVETALKTAGAKTAGAAAGHAVPDDSHAKLTNLLARLNAGASAVGDGANHGIVYKGNYPSIEAWITAQGW